MEMTSIGSILVSGAQQTGTLFSQIGVADRDSANRHLASIIGYFDREEAEDFRKHYVPVIAGGTLEPASADAARRANRHLAGMVRLHNRDAALDLLPDSVPLNSRELQRDADGEDTRRLVTVLANPWHTSETWWMLRGDPAELLPDPNAVFACLGAGELYDPVEGRRRWRRLALGLPAAFLVFLGLSLLTLLSTQIRRAVAAETKVDTSRAIDLAPYLPPVRHIASKKRDNGGGGGGDRSPKLPTRGRAPRQSKDFHFPAKQVLDIPQPKFPVTPTILVKTEIKLPDVQLPVWGNPADKVQPQPSNGPGIPPGIGSGQGGGVGNGTGPGMGDGKGPGIFTKGTRRNRKPVYNLGDPGVTNAIIISQPEPVYPPVARAAGVQGVVRLTYVIRSDGSADPASIFVTRSVSPELDQAAIDCLRRWRWNPATKDGVAVDVRGAEAIIRFRIQ